MGGNDDATVLALRGELKSLGHDHTIHSDPQLAAFLRTKDGDVSHSAAAVVDAEQWKTDNPVSIRDIAPFLRAPPGRSAPPGCVVLLEDMTGNDCARDADGRPVLLSIGMIHGTAEEMQRQQAYANLRAEKYFRPELGHHSCSVVIEVYPRDEKQTVPTFRFPDKNFRTLFDMNERVFPGSQQSTTHFCGLPRYITYAFKLCKPFMSADAYNNMKLKPDFKHLKKEKYLPTTSMLSSWDKEGTLEFDLDAYVEWRAKEEGFDLKDICPRGQGRSYDPEVQNAMEGLDRVSSKELLGAPSSPESEGGRSIVKHGPAKKRGSGRGMFANTKSKTKLLVAQKGSLFYFDSEDISAANLASRAIALDESCTAERTDDEPNGVRVTTRDRDFVFGMGSDEEADEWVSAVRECCRIMEPTIEEEEEN